MLKVLTVLNPRQAAGPEGPEKKTSKTIDTDDSTKLSDLSASNRNEKADGSVENSDVGMAQDSDDDFDRAQLTEKQMKRVLHEEVKKKII